MYAASLASMAGVLKGCYTLGVLKGIEGMVGPLHQRFDLIYCTSTGIIADSIALGRPVDEILELYKSHVVEVMKYLMPGKRRQRSKLWRRMCSNTKTSWRQRPASASCQLDGLRDAERSLWRLAERVS